MPPKVRASLNSDQQPDEPLARSAVLSPFTAIVGLASAGILWRFKVDTVWLLLAAGAVGWLWRLRG